MTVIAMSRTEIDRMSVLQDLATSRIKIAEAATLMGLGRRQVFRLAKAYAQRGPAALVSRKRGQPSNRCYAADLRDAAIGIIRERYPDFGPTLAAEKLAELHDIHLARETVRQWMITAGLWKDRRARLKAVHQPRYRRDCLGELIQIDGSEHWWFESRGPRCTLLVYIDDQFFTDTGAIEHSKELAQRFSHDPRLKDPIHSIIVLSESGTEIHREPVHQRKT